jgi:hypothetical protein
VESSRQQKREPMSNIEYNAEVDTLYLDVDEKLRENFSSIEKSLRKIELVLADINERLEALE